MSPQPPAPGLVEAAVQARIDVLREADELVGGDALAEIALTLARQIDADGRIIHTNEGQRLVDIDGRVIAALAKELRATLEDLAPKGSDDADLISQLIERLGTPAPAPKPAAKRAAKKAPAKRKAVSGGSTKVGDEAKPRKANARAKGRGGS